MTGVADTFQRASFAGVGFPYAERTIKGSLRHHTHEYPHAAGGDDEPLGRRLYEFGFTCDFDTGFSDYPGLYPTTLVYLFALFGEQRVGPLVIPGFGTFSARCIDWDTRKTSRITSGEKVSFKFIEVLDEIIVEQNFDDSPLAVPQYFTALKTQVTQIAAAPLGALPANARPKVSDLAQLEALTTALAATTSTATALLTQRAGAVFGSCQQYDTLTYLRYSRSYACVDALHDLARAALLIYKDALRRGRRIEIFVNDRLRSISEISTKLYGDTGQTVELMQINNLADALYVTAGTPIRHYTATA